MRTEPTVQARSDGRDTESSSGRPPVSREGVPTRGTGHVGSLAHLTSKPPLSGEAQRKLARRAQAKEKRAQDRLVETNMRLVVSIASKYRGEGMEFEDLVSEGVAGLLEGIRRFDPESGYQLSTYATFWIRRAILEAWAWQSRNLRLPRGVNDDLHTLQRASEYLSVSLGRGPSLDQLAQATALSRARVEELLKARRHTLSLEAPSGGSWGMMEAGEKSSLGDLLSDDEQTEEPDTQALRAKLAAELADALAGISEVERYIIGARHGLSTEQLTLRQVAASLNVSPEWVRQLQRRAEGKLRRLLRDHGEYSREGG